MSALMKEWIIFNVYRKLQSKNICIFRVHGVEEKEADSFTPAHCKRHNELSTHTHAWTHAHTYIHTQSSSRQVKITGYNERSVSWEWTEKNEQSPSPWCSWAGHYTATGKRWRMHATHRHTHADQHTISLSFSTCWRQYWGSNRLGSHPLGSLIAE